MTKASPELGFSDVVENGLCAGCGACAAGVGNVRMVVSDIGTYTPQFAVLTAAEKTRLNRICPFSDCAENEDTIAARLFSKFSLCHDKRFGYHDNLEAGHVADEDFRLGSSSGGLTSWVLLELLQRGLVDGVIHMGRDNGNGMLFAFTVSRNEEELLSHRKSHYYPGEFSHVLAQIRGDGKHYAFVGVPCFVKAIRLLCTQDPVLDGQICYAIGLVCGHLKSARFAELLAWQVGVPPSRLAAVDFRVKSQGNSAGHYEFAARASSEGAWHSKRSSMLYGGDWGQAFFQLKACDYCDDIFAETADVAFGDAWIPQYVKDWRGDNIVICRNPDIRAILTDGEALGTIHLEPVGDEAVHQSQAGNFRHRWDGLSVRLLDTLHSGGRMPRKRIRAGERKVGLLRKCIIRIRRKSSARSHLAFAQARATNDLALFIRHMRFYTRLMHYTHAAIQWLQRLGINRSL